MFPGTLSTSVNLTLRERAKTLLVQLDLMHKGDKLAVLQDPLLLRNNPPPAGFVLSILTTEYVDLVSGKIPKILFCERYIQITACLSTINASFVLGSVTRGLATEQYRC